MPLLRYAASLLLLLALASPALAADAPTDPIAGLTTAMQKRYETLGSFTASFSQTLTNAASGESAMRTGKIWFKRPMLIRWETRTPEPELLVLGDQDVWNWFALEETAYRYTAAQVLDSRTMLRFISGQARLDEEFWVADQGEEDGLRKLQLVPRIPEPSMVEAEVLVDPKQAVMTRITIIDFFGNANAVDLDNLVLDADCPDKLFLFTPPEGTDVFDNRGKTGLSEQPQAN